MLLDFIEQLFGVSPDGGDGFTELIYLSVLVLIVFVFACRKTILAFFERTFGR